eukprot:352205-Chlamydomonas_euryale.AAC.6
MSADVRGAARSCGRLPPRLLLPFALTPAALRVPQVITAKTHMVKRQDSKGNVVMREEPVWNWAVANITLLAVGSSSPEILLSLVDTIITLNQPAGQIGASTIVGSAAFNLFIIAAVCMVSLPTGTFRKIEHFKVRRAHIM